MHHRSACLALHIALIVAATLHHEVGNHAVKNGAVIVFVAHILQKVFDRFGCFVGVDLDHKLTQVGDEFHARCFLCMGHVEQAEPSQGDDAKRASGKE